MIKFSKKTIETLGKLKKGSISLWFKYIDVLNKQEILPIFYLGISSENKTDSGFSITGFFAGIRDDISKGDKQIIAYTLGSILLLLLIPILGVFFILKGRG